MKTVEEIIEYLQIELAEAHELHDMAEDRQERFFYLLKINFVTQLLNEIKN